MRIKKQMIINNEFFQLRTLVICCTAFLFACGEEPIFLQDCSSGNGLVPDCRFKNPEDMALLPDNKTLIISQFGGLYGEIPGSLVFYDTKTKELKPAYAGSESTSEPGETLWGDVACPSPPDKSFSPHGIDMERLPSGDLRLLVVNHGGRESIEFFQVNEDQESYSLRWQGCAIAPEDAHFNDVVNLRGGGFVVTHMMSRSTNIIWHLIIGKLLGMDTGFVYEWQNTNGFNKISGTDGGMPNGIEKSHNEQFIFVNLNFHSKVLKVDRLAQKLVSEVAISKPDNITWDSNNDVLLVASHTGSFSQQIPCDPIEPVVCGYAFEIVGLEPNKMQKTEILLQNEGPPMGAATVAIPVGNSLYIGTYTGDRIAVFRRSDTARSKN